ncbi:MAG: hypothetical protein EXR06_03870 [Rickettsiales bacterium]|nr:hypothetical protein [Rickettsiales bacterium]
MKKFYFLFLDLIKNIKQEIKVSILVALVVSIFSSSVTYYFLQSKIPKFAVVDLAYLNNDFVTNLSRYLIDHKAPDEEVAAMVRAYLATLETMLSNIHQSGNYVLLQKQMVISDNIVDLTKDLEKALFESVVINRQNIKTNLDE